MLYRNITNYKHPLTVKVSLTLKTGESNQLIEWVPDNEIYFIKQINVTADGLIVHSINIDGTPLEANESIDLVNFYGELVTAWETIALDLENPGTADAEATMEVIGYSTFRD